MMKCPNCNLCFNTITVTGENGIIILYKYCEICNSVYTFNKTQLFKVENVEIILEVKKEYKRRILHVVSK